MASEPTTRPLSNQLANSAVEYQDIQAEIAKLFASVLNVDVPLATTDLLDTGILDSQKFVELLFHLEQRFGAQIDVEDFEIENFRCIERIAKLVSLRKTSTGCTSS